MPIESPHNETFKKLLSLATSKGLKREGLFLLSGEKLIREFLKRPHLKIVYEILAPGQEPLAPAAKPVHLAPALFRQIDALGAHFNMLALEQPVLPEIPADITRYKPRGIELAAPLGDPGNLGALIRSCEAFAVPRVILTQEAAHPFLPRAVKASAGSVLRVPLARGPALAALPPDICIALDPRGTPIDDFVWPENALLLVGEEGPGFSARAFPRRVSIPTSGVESLNAVVAASIALSRIPKFIDD